MIRGLLLAIGLLLASDAIADLPKTGGNRLTVRVLIEADGQTLEQAKQNGFRSAIEQTVGQLIISDQEASGDRLVKDFVGGYSAGYVDDYEILESTQDEKSWHVKMNVAVASSKIAQRMMLSGNKTTSVNGQRLQAQLETQLESRQQGDNLLREVLSSYPYNAYVVNAGQTEVKISNARVPYVEVPYDITMSNFWLDALNEALTAVARDSKNCNSLTMAVSNGLRAGNTSSAVKNLAQAPCGAAPDMRVFSKKSGDFFSNSNSYYFYDLETLAMINSELQTPMGQQRIGLRISLLDAGGGTIDSRCADINTELFLRFSEPNLAVVNWNTRRAFLRPDIVGQNNVYGVLRVHLKNLEHAGDLAKVRLTVEKTCT